MPSEVKDIKQFIEICRRKDASCEQDPAPQCPERQELWLEKKEEARTWDVDGDREPSRCVSWLRSAGRKR